MESKPLVSFVVLVYMQEQYVEEAVLSALAQTYQPLEILITDDCSTDTSYQKIETIIESYEGPHKIILNRSSQNIGLAGSINRAWELTSGELVVVQAADDISRPERTTELAKLWLNNNPRPELVFSNVSLINAEGQITEPLHEASAVPTLDEVLRGQWFIAGGMACAYSRSIMAKYGQLDPRIVYEDFVLTFRALVGDGIAHSAMPLVLYRVSDNSITGLRRSEISMNRISAARWAEHLIAEYEDRLKTWQSSGKSNLLFSWKLKRHLSFIRLELLSTRASFSMALLCCLWAICTLRPRAAIRIFVRDVYRATSKSIPS